MLVKKKILMENTGLRAKSTNYLLTSINVFGMILNAKNL